jgi:type I restriction enzyme S subunit
VNRRWTVRLKDVADIDRRGIGPEEIEDGARYVGLEHIESGGASVTSVRVEAGDLASAKFRFSPNHILYGKLRPYLAKIVAPDFSGVCSTDILPIRPGKQIDKRFLLHFLRLPENVAWASGRATGVNLPRLSPSELADLSIPLPPLDEQRQIAAILDKADALRQKRKRAIALLESLRQSIFLEMFGDLGGYRRVPLSDVIADGRIGLVRSSLEFGPGQPTPYVRMDAIRRENRLDLAGVQGTTVTSEELELYELRSGDFLFNTRNSRELVGKSAVFRGPSGMVYNNNILRLRFSPRLLPEFLVAYLRTAEGQQKLEERKAGTTSVFAIYQKSIAALPIPLPPVGVQMKYRDRVGVAERWRSDASINLGRLNTLFSSLQHRAFSGQL